MREFVRPVATALGIACLAASIATVSATRRIGAGQAGGAEADGPRPATEPAQEAPLKQMALTEKQVEGVLSAAKEIDPITEKLPDDGKPDPEDRSRSSTASPRRTASPATTSTTASSTISALVLGGFDPATKKYVGPEAVIKAQIAQVQADKKMSAKDKKEMLADLNEALEVAGAGDREQGQYRPGRQILRQARRRLGRRAAIDQRGERCVRKKSPGEFSGAFMLLDPRWPEPRAHGSSPGCASAS